MTRFSSHSDVFDDEIPVITPYMLSQKTKNYNFDPMHCFQVENP